MENEESVSTRIWLEKQTIQTNANKAGADSYTTSKFKLEKKLATEISQYIKLNHISWEMLIHAVFGILICRSAKETVRVALKSAANTK